MRRSAHELRTPLNGILGYARLLNMEGGLNDTQAMRVDAMLAAGRHLLHMVSRVLDLSEIEAERLELQNELIDVQSVAAACIELVRPDAEQKRLVLSLDASAGAPRHIVADAMRLQQILVNLLGNAVKFTSAGSVAVRVLPVPDDCGVRIEVADTGPGIPADQRARLFQDFARLDNAATRGAEGAGLGLALSARLAAFMDGRMGLEDRPGGGSIFWLELPTTNAGAALAMAPGVAGLPAPDGEGESEGESRAMTILVVDDILMNRDIAGSILAAAGHHVTCVEGGAEAITAVAATGFDVVLMDVRMPEMDGLEATRRIRALEGPHRHVPILALTAQAFTEQIAECRRAGMNGHLGKPFDADSLLAAVVRAAAAHGAAAHAPEAAQAPGPKPVLGEELPIFDPEGYERTAAFLAPGKIALYLRTLADSGEALLHELRAPDALAQNGPELAEKAHALASSAGNLGFARVATLSRRFEYAVKRGAAEARDLAAGLEAALEATLHDMEHRIDAVGRLHQPAAGASGTVPDAARLHTC
jgi:CheY-like chemotaxis protein/HPt (histidine-containing phosphotransfer) domain-containing protein